MASSTSRALEKFESANEDIADNIGAQLTALRRDIASISASIGEYSAGRLGRNALSLVRHQGADAAKEIRHQANVAGRVVRDNPVPVLVALGTIALISALVFTRDGHRLW